MGVDVPVGGIINLLPDNKVVHLCCPEPIGRAHAKYFDTNSIDFI